MTPQEYDDTFHYIQRNLEQITAFAVEHAIKEKLDDMLTDYRKQLDEPSGYDIEEMDYWFAFGDRVDLNYVSRNLTDIVCLAYPVVNGVPNYDEEYEIPIPFPTDWNK
jgi:hypothetical protein